MTANTNNTLVVAVTGDALGVVDGRQLDGGDVFLSGLGERGELRMMKKDGSSEVKRVYSEGDVASGKHLSDLLTINGVFIEGINE